MRTLSEKIVAEPRALRRTGDAEDGGPGDGSGREGARQPVMAMEVDEEDEEEERKRGRIAVPASAPCAAEVVAVVVARPGRQAAPVRPPSTKEAQKKNHNHLQPMSATVAVPSAKPLPARRSTLLRHLRQASFDDRP
jgi:hypothetical protein